MFKFFLYLFIAFWGWFSLVMPAFAKSLDEEIADISRQITELDNSIAPLKKESTDLKIKIAGAKATITKIENQAAALAIQVIEKESDLEIQKTLLSERVRRYYINTKKFNPLMIFLSSAESTSLLRQFSWYQSIISQDRSTITTYVNDITSLNQNKKNLETEKNKTGRN